MNSTVIHIGIQNAIKMTAFRAIKSRAGTIISVNPVDGVVYVALWNQDDITIRAKGGRVGLPGRGQTEDGKHSAYQSVLERRSERRQFARL